jgi:hypothetical protein
MSRELSLVSSARRPHNGGILGHAWFRWFGMDMEQANRLSVGLAVTAAWEP